MVLAIDWVLMLQPIAAIIISSKLGYSADKPSTLEWCSTATAENTKTRIDCAVEVYTFNITDLLPCLIFEVWRELHLSRLNLLVRCENIVAVFETRCAQLMNERSHTNLVEQPKFRYKILCRELIIEPVLCNCCSSSHWGSRHLLAHYSLHSVSLQLTTEVVKQIVHIEIILLLLGSFLVLVSHEVYERIFLSICVEDCLCLQKVYRSKPAVTTQLWCASNDNRSAASFFLLGCLMHWNLHLESPKLDIVFGTLRRHFDDFVNVRETSATNPRSWLILIDIMIPGKFIPTEHKEYRLELSSLQAVYLVHTRWLCLKQLLDEDWCIYWLTFHLLLDPHHSQGIASVKCETVLACAILSK